MVLGKRTRDDGDAVVRAEFAEGVELAALLCREAFDWTDGVVGDMGDLREDDDEAVVYARGESESVPTELSSYDEDDQASEQDEDDQASEQDDGHLVGEKMSSDDVEMCARCGTSKYDISQCCECGDAVCGDCDETDRVGVHITFACPRPSCR